MKTITYKFNDGTTNTVEVTDEFYALYAEMEKSDMNAERKEKRRQQSLDKSLEHGWDIPDPNSNVALLTEQNEEKTELENAMKQLTEKQKTIFILFKLEGLSMREIGRRLGLNKDTVREHYLSAIKKLKKLLQ